MSVTEIGQEGLREALLAMPVSVWLESKQDRSGHWSVEGWSCPRTKLYEVVSVRRTSPTEWWVDENKGGLEETISLVFSQAKGMTTPIISG